MARQPRHTYMTIAARPVSRGRKQKAVPRRGTALYIGRPTSLKGKLVAYGYREHAVLAIVVVYFVKLNGVVL